MYAPVGGVSTSGVVNQHWSDVVAVPATTKLLLCGGVAGAFSKTCTAPLARLTILRQLQSTGAVPGWTPGQNHGLLLALGKITREEGLRALWKGNLVTVIHRLPYSSINFYAYENIMDWLEGEGRYAKNKEKAGGYSDTVEKEDGDAMAVSQTSFAWDVIRRLVAGGSAGMIACTATYPLDLVRTRLAAQTTVHHYNGLFHALYTIAKDEGVRGLYRGLSPTLVGVGPNLAINFAAYETFRKLAAEHDLGIPAGLNSLACGSSAAVVSATATYPLDLVRRRLQMRCAKDRGQGFVRVLQGIWASEGLAGFYRGIIAEYANVVPVVSITYASYEFLKRSIGVDTGRL